MPRLNLRPLKAEVRSLARVTSLDKFVILFIMIHATQNKVHVSIGYKFIIVLMVFCSDRGAVVWSLSNSLLVDCVRLVEDDLHLLLIAVDAVQHLNIN